MRMRSAPTATSTLFGISEYAITEEARQPRMEEMTKIAADYISELMTLPRRHASQRAFSHGSAGMFSGSCWP